MNMEFTEWLVENAEEFEIKDHPTLNGIKFFAYPSGCFTFTDEGFPSEHPAYRELIYPRLITKAIEGVNRKQKTYTIEVAEMVCVYEYMPEDDGIYFEDAKTIDEEKESALRYIYKQENK